MNGFYRNSYTYRLADRKRVPLEGSGRGFTTVPDGESDVTIGLEIDLFKLAAALARRASRNRTQKAVLWGGLVSAKVTTKKKVRNGVDLAESQS